MKRADAWPYVAHYVDDCLSILRDTDMPDPSDKVRLVGWQCGFEPMFVAVWSYLGVRLSNEEATDLAVDLLLELGWFELPNAFYGGLPDYIL